MNHTQISRVKTVLELSLSPDSRFDQRKVTEEGIIHRVAIIAAQGDHVGQRVLGIGDADLTALSLAAIGSQEETVVADIDKRLADVYFDAAMELDLEARFVYHDMRIKIIEILRKQFSVIVTEPMRTREGVELFLSRAAQCVTENGRVYVSYASEIEQVIKEVSEKIGFDIIKNEKNLFTYEDGGEGGMIILHANDSLKPLIEKHYLGPLFEREVNMEPKPYECSCREIILVGKNQKFQTIKELYSKGCPSCGAKEIFAFHSDVPRE